MSAPDLDAIKARLVAATPGPWVAGWAGDPADGFAEAAPLNVIAFNQGEVADVSPHQGNHADTWEQALSNADLMAHARVDLAALVTEVERLRRALHDQPGGCQIPLGEACPLCRSGDDLPPG